MNNYRNHLNELLNKAQNGNEKSLNELCEIIHIRLRKKVQYRLRGRAKADIDDLMQEILIVFVKKLHHIENNPLSYTHGIMNNKLKEYYRRIRREIWIPIKDYMEQDEKPRKRVEHIKWEIADPRSDFLLTLEAEEQIDQISKAIKGLSPFCQAFFLNILEGRDPQELWYLIKKLEPHLNKNAYYQRKINCRLRLEKLVKR